ncbi:MAG: HAMP domain-containing protein [Rhodanobacteraceae bacterium]|nr:HAMP domain-containing protein [Rhodanobacteraceae bacterium]
MMQRLFWRLFAAFWVATVFMLVAFAWVSTSMFETDKIPGLDITRLQAAMDDLLARTARELRREGEDATRQWLRSAEGFGPTTVYVFDADAGELLGRPVSDNVREAALATLADAKAGIEAAGAAHGTERLRARAIRTRDGRLYAAVAAREGAFLTRLVSRRPRAFWLNIGIAMAVSAAFALLLAGYVTAPLTRIRASTRRFAEGDFDARVGRLRFGRSAEVTALASEFDGMAERIKALVDSHRRLVRDVSHELRSPLARLRVAVELARDGDARQVNASLDRIECEADRLEAMLAQSLQLSRLETATDAPRDDIALDGLLEDVITNADYEGAPRGRKVVLAECERLHLRGSYSALHSAFENVIRNALAYTADGSTVSVRLGHDPGHAERALITVRDHGPGVPEAELERIFEPFYRTDSARTRSSGGTGLGLAIARRAIERHGGSISARNLDRGLEVAIRLPLPGAVRGGNRSP